MSLRSASYHRRGVIDRFFTFINYDRCLRDVVELSGKGLICELYLDHITGGGTVHTVRNINRLKLEHHGALPFAGVAVEQTKAVAQFMGEGVRQRFGIGQEWVDDDSGPRHDPVSGCTVSFELCEMAFGFIEDLTANNRQAILTIQRKIH